MHELSLVDELVAVCRERAQGRPIRQVRVRCPASVGAEELRAGFALAAKEVAGAVGDRCLAGAELRLQLVPVQLRCPCGFEGQLSEEYLAGHMTVCPQCGRVADADDGLDLVSISFWAGRGALRPHLRDQVP